MNQFSGKTFDTRENIGLHISIGDHLSDWFVYVILGGKKKAPFYAKHWPKNIDSAEKYLQFFSSCFLSRTRKKFAEELEASEWGIFLQ